MDVNKESEGFDFVDEGNEGNDMFYPFGTEDMFEMDFNPYEHESEPTQGFGGTSKEFSGDPFNSYDDDDDEEEEKEYEPRKVDEEVRPIYFFTDATIQRLFDNNKLIFVNPHSFSY